MSIHLNCKSLVNYQCLNELREHNDFEVLICKNHMVGKKRFISDKRTKPLPLCSSHGATKRLQEDNKKNVLKNMISS